MPGNEADKKTVPASEMMKYKDKLKEAEQEITKLHKKLEIAGLGDVSDEDLKNVKEYFFDRDAAVDSRESSVKEREDAVQAREEAQDKRERDSSIQSLAIQYAPKAKEGEDENKVLADFAEALKEADDPEKEAMRLYTKRLKEEGAELPSSENAFERTPAGGKVAKSPIDMTPEEVTQFEKEHAIKK